MNVSIWIAVFLPIFVTLYIVLPQQYAVFRIGTLNSFKRKDGSFMTNELLKKYLGENCIISTGTFGIRVEGKITDVNENWIEVETKKGNELINSQFIQNVKIKHKK